MVQDVSASILKATLVQETRGGSLNFQNSRDLSREKYRFYSFERGNADSLDVGSVEKTRKMRFLLKIEEGNEMGLS